jgi:serine/threonine-protein kinase
MSADGRTIRFGVFEVDLRSAELRKQGLRIKLRDQPFQILSLLLARPGQVVSRDELQKTLWPADTYVDFDRGLNKAISHLRDVLGDSADSPRFIETLPKRGYRFVAPVENAQLASPPDGQPPAAAIGASPLSSSTDLLPSITAAPEQVLSLPSDRMLRRDRRFRLGPPASVVAWTIAGLSAFAAIAAGLLLWRASRPPDRPMMRFTDDLGPEAITGRAPITGAIFSPVISPDGRRLVFSVKGDAGGHRLATRMLDQSAIYVLPGTEGGEDPFFSPNGQWIGFFADQRMKKVWVQGGAAVTLCDTSGAPRGGSWGEDGTIIANLDLYHLFRVSPLGGRPQVIGKPEEHGERAWRWPQILPGGDKVLFTGAPASAGAIYDNANIEVLSLRSGQVKIVQQAGYFGRYLPSGHLLYLHNGTLFAIPFDLARLETRGMSMPVLEDMADTPGTGLGRFDFSRTGTLVYFSNKAAEALAPTSWISSAGKVDPVINTPTQAETPRLSPDGKRLALTVAGDLSVYDLQRGTLTKLTFDAALNRRPIWTPDGKHIVFASDTPSPSGEYGMWWIRADGSSQPEKLIAERTPLQPWSISPDGRRIAFVRTDSDRNFEIWTLALDFTGSDRPKSRELQAFLPEQAGQVDPTFSPDGKWIAYASTTLGGPKVVVRPFPSTSSASRWQISEGNGRFPLWSRNGRELFYLDNNDHIMVVRYSVIKDLFISEKPTQWSPVSIFRPMNRSLWNLDLAPDGKRFVALAKPATRAENVHATVLLNFLDELRRRWPEK